MNSERKINYCDTIFGKRSVRISEHSRSLLSTPGKKMEKIGNSGEIIFDAFAGLQNKSRASVREIEWGAIPQKHRNKCRSCKKPWYGLQIKQYFITNKELRGSRIIHHQRELADYVSFFWTSAREKQKWGVSKVKLFSQIKEIKIKRNRVEI